MTDCPAAQQLRESPFFVLDGPEGRRLSCQWTAWNAAEGRAATREFEIVCPETPETMGLLFGLFEDGAFSMRRAVVVDDQTGRLRYAPSIDLDQDWRGTIADVLEVGTDWIMRDDGLLAAVDGEEPARDPVEAAVRAASCVSAQAA